MEEFGEWNFKLSKADQNGVTEREHLEQVERQTGKTPEPLIGPDFPQELSYIWSVFLHLSNARSVGFSGPNPLSYQEIKAWMEVTDNNLEPWEVEAIKRLDNVYMKVLNG